MSQRKLTRPTFYKVKRYLMETQLTQEDIAKRSGVSTSMVSLINRSGTWENYLAGKSAPKLVRKAVTTRAAFRAFLKENMSEKSAADKLDEGLKKVTAKQPTQFQLEQDIKRLEGRLTIQYAGLSGLYRHWLFNLLFGRAVRNGIQESVREEQRRGRN